jgi:hypothetical protein
MSHCLKNGLRGTPDGNGYIVHADDLTCFINTIEELEKYVCACVSVFAQHDIEPPVPSEEIKKMLMARFLSAVKGEENG